MENKKRVLEVYRKLKEEYVKKLNTTETEEKGTILIKKRKVPDYLWDHLDESRPYMKTPRKRIETRKANNVDSKLLIQRGICDAIKKQDKILALDFSTTLNYDTFRMTHSRSFKSKLNPSTTQLLITKTPNHSPKKHEVIRSISTSPLNYTSKLITKSLLSSGRPIFIHRSKLNNDFIEKYIGY